MTWREKLLAHIEIMRPYTLSYAGLLALSGAALGSKRRMQNWRAFRGAVVAMLGWLAGHYVGDYFDREIDAQSKPGRPVPSGRVTPHEAVMFMLLLIACGNAAAFSLGIRNLALACVTTALGLAYSKIFKAKALLGNLDRGILGACAVVFGALTSTDRLAPEPLLLATATIAHDGATNLVGAVRDVEGDRTAGCQTVPVVYGVARSVDIASVLASVALAFGATAHAIARPSRTAIALFATASVLDVAVYGSLLTMRGRLTRAGALTAHKILVLERLLLAASFIAVRAPKLAVSLVITSAPASLVLQALMRDRHERTAIDLQ